MLRVHNRVLCDIRVVRKAIQGIEDTITWFKNIFSEKPPLVHLLFSCRKALADIMQLVSSQSISALILPVVNDGFGLRAQLPVFGAYEKPPQLMQIASHEVVGHFDTSVRSKVSIVNVPRHLVVIFQVYENQLKIVPCDIHLRT